MFVDVFVCGSVSVSLFASVMSDIICLGACVGVWHQSVGLCVSVCVSVCRLHLCVVCISVCRSVSLSRDHSMPLMGTAVAGRTWPRPSTPPPAPAAPDAAVSHLVAVDHCGGVIGRDDVVARDDVAAVGSSVGRAGQRATATDCHG